MLDFKAVRERKTTMAELANGLTTDDLRALTHEMVDAIHALIKDCADADVTFVPVDLAADDAYAADDSEKKMAWTLGHVIVHTTASAEEAAFLAAEMARGVPNHGRSRSEVPWRTVTSIAQCRDRLEESRRMRMAMLDVWPGRPNTDVVVEPFPGSGPRNCYARFLGGLAHDDSHLGQIAEIVRQAKSK